MIVYATNDGITRSVEDSVRASLCATSPVFDRYFTWRGNNTKQLILTPIVPGGSGRAIAEIHD